MRFDSPLIRHGSERRKRALVADDNPRMVDAMANLIQGSPEFGEVVTAGDGKEAIELAELYAPDVIVLDLSMPVIDGLAAARKIREFMPDVPIVLCTIYGYALSVKPAVLNSWGIQAVVNKDQAFSKLVPTLQKLLTSKAA